MASSANSSNPPQPWVRYSNKDCFCGRECQIVISDSKTNLNRLYYACKLNKCRFYKWCEPVNEDSSSELPVEFDFDSRFGKIEEDVNDMIMIHAAEMEDTRVVTRETYFEMKKEVDEITAEMKKYFENEVYEMKKEFETKNTSMRTDLKLIEETMKMELEKHGQTVKIIHLLIISMILVLGCMLFTKVA